MPAPAAMRHLADLRDQFSRIERPRVRLIDRGPDDIAAELRAVKARLRQKRAAA